MEWQPILVVVVVALLALFFPAAVICYLTIGAIYTALKEKLNGKDAAWERIRVPTSGVRSQ